MALLEAKEATEFEQLTHQCRTLLAAMAAVDDSEPGDAGDQPIDLEALTAEVPPVTFQGEPPAWYVAAVAGEASALGNAAEEQRLGDVLSGAEVPSGVPAIPKSDARDIARARGEAELAARVADAEVAAKLSAAASSAPDADGGAPSGEGKPSTGATGADGASADAGAPGKGPTQPDVGAVVAAADARNPAREGCRELTQRAQQRFWRRVMGVLAGSAWGAAFGRSLGTVTTTPTAGDAVALWFGVLLLTAAAAALLVVVLYVARAIIAYERLSGALHSAVSSAASASAHGEPRKGVLAWTRNATKALLHVGRRGGAARIRTIQTSVLLYGDAAAFAVAAVWFSALHQVIPSTVDGPMGLAGPIVWMFIPPGVVAMLLRLVDVCRIRAASAAATSSDGADRALQKRQWAFGDTAKMGDAFSGTGGGGANEVSTAARVGALDFVVTETESAGIYFTAMSVYSGIVALQLHFTGIDPTEEAWLAFASVMLGMCVGFAFHHYCTRRSRVVVPAAGTSGEKIVELPSMPGWMSRVSRAGGRGTGCCGARRIRTKLSNLCSGALTFLCVMSLNGALRAAVSTSSPTPTAAGTGMAYIDVHAWLAGGITLFFGLLVVAVRWGTQTFVLDPLYNRVAVQAARTAAARQRALMFPTKSNVSAVWASRMREHALRLVADVRAKYVTHARDTLQNSASLMAGLAWNQVVLDAVDAAASPSGAAFAYAIVTTSIIALVEVVFQPAGSSAATPTQPTAPNGGDSQTPDHNVPASALPDLPTALLVLDAARKRLHASELQAAALKKQLAAMIQ